MQQTINQRVKQLRKELKLTQNEFSRIIAISSGQLACIETEKRSVNDRTVKLICDSFKASEQWLRYGEGAHLDEDHDSRYTKLAALFSGLRPQYQDFIYLCMDYFLKIQDSGNQMEHPEIVSDV
jgi:transcriptional regulator with XRE-family HTH domain